MTERVRRVAQEEPTCVPTTHSRVLCGTELAATCTCGPGHVAAGPARFGGQGQWDGADTPEDGPGDALTAIAPGKNAGAGSGDGDAGDGLAGGGRELGRGGMGVGTFRNASRKFNNKGKNGKITVL